MFLTVISPLGLITSLDLLATPIWRLELRAQPWLATDAKALALGVSYSSQGAFMVICAINCQVTDDTVEPIAKLGFPEKDRVLNKERLREAMKALINAGILAKDVDAISVASAGLVDAYFDIQRAMWGMNPSLNSLGPAAKGDMQGWRWALTRERFSAWLGDTLTAAAGMGPAPGAVTPYVAPPVVVPPPAAPPADELAGNSIGPPPGTEKRGGKKKPPAEAAGEA